MNQTQLKIEWYVEENYGNKIFCFLDELMLNSFLPKLQAREFLKTIFL